MKIEIRLNGQATSQRQSQSSDTNIDSIVEKVYLLDRRRSKDKIRNQSAWLIPLHDDTLACCIEIQNKIRKIKYEKSI